MKVKCINDLGSKDLTLNKEYTVIYQGQHWFEIINDSNNKYTYLINAFEIVKEENEMKEFTFEEVIANIKEGETYKCTDCLFGLQTITKDNIGFKFNKNSEAHFSGTNGVQRFVKVEKPVSFVEAINAGLEGKMIKVDVTELNEKYRNIEDCTCVLNSYWNNCWSSIKCIFEMLGKTEKHTSKIINEGKWYIKED